MVASVDAARLAQVEKKLVNVESELEVKKSELEAYSFGEKPAATKEPKVTQALARLTRAEDRDGLVQKDIFPMLGSTDLGSAFGRAIAMRGEPVVQPAAAMGSCPFCQSANVLAPSLSNAGSSE